MPVARNQPDQKMFACDLLSQFFLALSLVLSLSFISSEPRPTNYSHFLRQQEVAFDKLDKDSMTINQKSSHAHFPVHFPALSLLDCLLLARKRYCPLSAH